MRRGRQKKRQGIHNPAKRRPITEPEAVRIANAESFQRMFNPDYYQVMLRISDAESGLKNGAPPGPVQ